MWNIEWRNDVTQRCGLCFECLVLKDNCGTLNYNTWPEHCVFLQEIQSNGFKSIWRHWLIIQSCLSITFGSRASCSSDGRVPAPACLDPHVLSIWSYAPQQIVLSRERDGGGGTCLATSIILRRVGCGQQEVLWTRRRTLHGTFWA